MNAQEFNRNPEVIIALQQAARFIKTGQELANRGWSQEQIITRLIAIGAQILGETYWQKVLDSVIT